MALAYLLSPTFEITNSAGKPATGGYIEVYVAGTRNKYYCASDFDGTLHPFRIPLDSLGANIVLAEDTGTYDVYVYNRYGGQMMSRYNVKAGGGGSVGIGSITSSDGSISVTPTSTGVDLRVDLETPSILRATAQSMTGDGLFQFSELQRDGQGATVDVSGKVILSGGWWHYDATARLRWPGTPGVGGTQSVSIYTANGSDSMDFDLSYAHSETVQISGEYKAASDGTQFVLGMSGIPAGLTVELVDFGIHSIVGGSTSDGVYYAGEGIQIDETTRVISVDMDTVQEKLTAGTGITIENNVISASGSFAQVQADWTENDTSSPAYIKHRPDLSQYATDQELTAGLATKQDTISDLATIRAGAAAGATAVQPADLSSYATDAELTSGLSTKQDTINDLSTIRSGAAAGSTAVQPADLAEVAITGNYNDLSNKPTIPTKTSDLTNDSGFITDADAPVKDVQVEGVSVVNAQGVANISIPASGVLDVEVDGTSVVNAQGVAEIDLSGYATTQALTTGLAGKQDTISDLSTIRSGAAAGATAVQPGSLATVAMSGSYNDLSNKPTIPTVDQTYNASSANAQSGVAVAQAIAAAPAGSYTAGDGISIEQDEISVAYDTDTLQINSPSSNIYSKNAFTGEIGNMYGTIEDGALATAIQTANSFTLHIPGNTFSTSENMTGREILLVLSSDPYFNTLGWNIFVPLSFTTQGGTTWIDEQNVTIPGFGAPGWIGDVPFYPYAFRFEIASDGDLIGTTVEPTSPTFSSPVLFTYGSEGGLAVKNPLPSSDVLDEDKVLTVNSNGTPVWATPASVTVDQVYNASSTNAQSGTAVAGAISGINQVPASTSSDADKVLTVNAQGTPAWASAQAPITAGNGIDITNNVVSVDTSVVATQTDLADKEDAFDVGTGLEMDTSGATPTLQVEAPVDIVAGPGIVIDNPDGNTLRVSVASDYETVLWDNPNGQSTGQLSLSESPLNFEYIAVYAQAKNPTGSDGFQYGNFGQFYTRMLSKTLKNQDAFVDFVHMDENNTTTAFTWYSLATKWSGASTTTWTWCRSELNGNSVNDWYYMLRIVGIHRLANN